MKNLSLLLNVAFIGFFIFEACRPDKKPDKCGRLASKEYKMEDLKGLIKADLACRMSEEYNADKGKRFIWEGDAATDTEDATAIYFEIEQLKNYIYQIESRVCATCDDKTTLAIRFYLGKYPKKSEMIENPFLADLPPSYARRQTLFMVPAFKNGDYFQDFDPFKMRDSCGFSKYNCSGLDTGQLKPALILTVVDNHGGLEKPPPGDGRFGNEF